MLLPRISNPSGYKGVVTYSPAPPPTMSKLAEIAIGTRVYHSSHIDILRFVILHSAGSLLEYLFIPHLTALTFCVRYCEFVPLTFGVLHVFMVYWCVRWRSTKMSSMIE